MASQKEALLVAISKGYRVDDLGNVFGLKGNILKLQNSYGYKSFNVRVGKDTTRVPVHRFQAFFKYGKKIFKKGMVVRHKNGDSLNNKKSNILIGTHQQNMMDIPKEKRILNASNPKHNHKEILEDYNSGLNYSQIQKKHQISSKGTISFIINKSMAAA